jgi:hypothetical protein
MLFLFTQDRAGFDVDPDLVAGQAVPVRHGRTDAKVHPVDLARHRELGPGAAVGGVGGEPVELIFAAVLLAVISFFNLLDGIAAIANSHILIGIAHYVVRDAL